MMFEPIFRTSTPKHRVYNLFKFLGSKGNSNDERTWLDIWTEDEEEEEEVDDERDDEEEKEERIRKRSLHYSVLRLAFLNPPPLCFDFLYHAGMTGVSLAPLYRLEPKRFPKVASL
jgi:hypothetical protein